MTWQETLEEHTNARLEVKHKLDGSIIARLEVTYIYTVYYHGEGATVAEALANLNADIEMDCDPMEPDYRSLARDEPMTASAQLRVDSGVGLS